MFSEVYIKGVFPTIEMSRDTLFHTGNAYTSFYSWKMYDVRVAVSQSKRIEMGLKRKVCIKIILGRIEMSRDKLFHTGNARTSFKSWQMYVVRVAVSHSKRIEMGLRGIEMS